MPILFWHTFFGQNLANFRPIGPKTFMGTQGIIIYWLVMRHFILVIMYFWRKMGMATMPAPKLLVVWSLQTRPKSWLTRLNFRANRYLEIMFSKFLGVNYWLFSIYNRGTYGNEFSIHKSMLFLTATKWTIWKLLSKFCLSYYFFMPTLMYENKIPDKKKLSSIAGYLSLKTEWI